jgi:hypothetical protein
MPIQTFELEWRKCYIKQTKPQKLLTNKDIYASVKNPTIIETIILDYVGLGMYREWKKTEFPKGYYIRIWEQQE